ncbi:FG-GAP-like repeat-containing protein [Arcicella sp. LKC2W]|uniref:FG-GAP repeat domain-containing protein n=1 Tax=Arcicella sp. LKC2W TaxID=2984198 RepID=UPI002B20CA80|nr:FG-GAP-like repeat-containing protein [Arcicella sp. LKC2W]MEA5459945.1 FG-GAP-like repeat-containing protein [Arcicella sp. LKC2W]
MQGIFTHKFSFLIFIFLIFLSYEFSFAQDFTFKFDNSLKIVQNGQTLTNAFTGGINAPQFSTCKLDKDGIDDLVVFDRTAQKLYTFLAKQDNTGKYFWQYAPQFESAFPKINNWILLRDYNRDGKKDIFTYTPGGIKAYKNTTTDNLSFQLFADPIYSTGYSGKLNLYLSSTDMPSIADIDNDGDDDIVAFDVSGNFTMFHRNFSIENYKNADNLEFRRVGDCWGGFYKEHFDDIVFNQPCGDNPVPLANPFETDKNAKILHSGNSLLLLDINGDGLKDILFGHVTKNNVASLNNTGTLARARFSAANYKFPNAKPIDFAVFPAMYYEDLDFDGVKDLISSPNGADNALQTVDYQNSVWFYKNIGKDDKPDFSFVQTNMLQNSMVDLGENTAPVFADIDGDGDQDLLVGNAGNRGDTGYRASISLFENKGNNTFELTNNDYLGIAKNQQLFEIKPFITDLNADGVDDFGFISNSFVGASIRYFPNRAAKGKAFDVRLTEVVTIPSVEYLANGDYPLFFDLNKDGLKDLLLGKGSGRLEYYKNTGTAQKPIYTIEKDQLGGITDDYTVGNISLAVADLNGDGKEELITGSRSGFVKVYKNVTEQNQTKFVADSTSIFDEFNNKNAQLPLGGMLNIAVSDLNNDLIPDLMIGTNTGGLKWLKNTSKFLITSTEEQKNFIVYPNPTSRYLYVKNPIMADYELFDTMGRKVLSQRNQTTNQDLVLDLAAQTDGIYILKISKDGKIEQTEKVLLRK